MTFEHISNLWEKQDFKIEWYGKQEIRVKKDNELIIKVRRTQVRFTKDVYCLGKSTLETIEKTMEYINKEGVFEDE